LGGRGRRRKCQKRKARGKSSEKRQKKSKTEARNPQYPGN